jgi:DNA polymerase-3 subunit epsilon
VRFKERFELYICGLPQITLFNTMQLNLNRPLAFFDLETTGLNVSTDRIIELSVLKVNPDGSQEVVDTRINPEIPISPKATSIHGINDSDLVSSPKFGEIAHSLATFLEGCDLAGYNAIKFDIPVLVEEFLRVGYDFNINDRKFVDVQVIFHRKEQRTLGAAYQFYCKKDLDNAHSALADATATFEILKAQLDRYDDLENEVSKLSEISSYNNIVDFAGRIIFDENGVEIFNFGKHKGKAVEKVFKEDPGYYSWMMNGDFPLYTKKVLTELKSRFTPKKTE